MINTLTFLVLVVCTILRYNTCLFCRIRKDIMNKYITSDLVMENTYIEKIRLNNKNTEKNKSLFTEELQGACKICRLDVKNAEQEREYGCKKGRYITVYTPRLCDADIYLKEELSGIIAKELSQALSIALKKTISPDLSFLVAGIGNRRIASDSIGPLTVEKINVTRHVKVISPESFSTLDVCSVYSLACGVMGETGIQSVELLRAVADKLSPDAVIVVDALAAKEYDRLAATVQISDVGISPGAGIGNRQSSITKETLGVPVIAVGVPTVVSAATVIGDALIKSKYGRISSELEKILERGKNHFVAPKECDIIAQSASEILALSIDKALGVI